ncbi:GNAT family N-acetyltransferase [Rhodococcus sp. SJ-2]
MGSEGRVVDTNVLDNPVHTSLTGDHAHLARRAGRAVTYRADAATFCAVPPDPEQQDWSDLARLLGSGALADLFDCPHAPPNEWKPVFSVDGLQMLAPAPGDHADAPDLAEGAELHELGPGDRQAMLDLVDRTRPGPFYPRTPELGTYLGIRHGSTLVAMAGERLHPPGWTEISAVCTAPDARGHGYAGHLVQALSARIAARGERAFLHVLHSNTRALDLYSRLGFQPRKDVRFRGFEVP